MKPVPPEQFQNYIYWLALHRISGVGPAIFLKLKATYQSVRQVFTAARFDELRAFNLKPEAIQQILSFGPTSSLYARAEKDLQWLTRHNHHLLTIDDAAYPALLKQIPDPPPMLFVAGDPTCLSELQLAMVGSRKASLLGMETARSFARQISNAGLIVTSGMALGIDCECHRGALEGAMPTIAILGSGLDRIYPLRHRKLAEQIVFDGGCLVSEFPLGTGALPANFPMRNRIISGLSLGTLVVEATLRSGSLITARNALEQNREVFAIPGSIHIPGSRGCHELIRQGAKLVEKIEDVFEELTGLCEFQLEELKLQPKKEHKISYSETETAVMSELSLGTKHLDTLVENTHISIAQLMSTLIELEIKGIIKPDVAGYTLIPPSLRR